MKLPSWTPPFYEDGTVPGEQTAGKSNVIVTMLTAIYNGLVGLPIVQAGDYGFSVANSAAGNTTALNEAVAAVPARGGIVELPAGSIAYNGANVKGRSNVKLRGQGGLSGGAGLGGGVPGQNESATVLADGRGAGTERSMDMRNGIACGLEHVTLMVYNPAFPAGGAIWDLSSQQCPFCREVTVMTAVAKAGELMPGAWCVVLGGVGNSGTFIDLTIKGGAVGVIGSTTALYEGKAQESVAHNFYNFRCYAMQQCAIFNPWWNWNFFGGSIEEKRDNKGELIGAGAVEVNRQCYSLAFYGTWIGGDKVSAKETGVQIKWEGNDLRIVGGTLGNAETLIECVGPCDKIVVDGTMCLSATNAIKLHEEVERVDYRPMKPPPGQTLPTNGLVGTSKANGWQKKEARAVNSNITPSKVAETQVLLTIKCKAEATLVEIMVNGGLVNEVGSSSGGDTLSVFFTVPATQTFQVKTKTGTPETVTSSYRFI